MNAPALSSSPMQELELRIDPLRTQLAAHPLYTSMHTLGDVRTFMQSHVFAVWDFMCLLKSLQRALTSVDVLWAPTPYPASRRFINEIVLGEESDEFEGRPASHFELYLEAMDRAGADTAVIRGLIATLSPAPQSPQVFDAALERAPVCAQRFVHHTLSLVRGGSLAAQAAAFTFGREDAIPGMFRALVRDLNREANGSLDLFIWYLERHIEVDGDDHGPLALCMVSDLCGDNPQLWEDATRAAEEALRARLALWDGILDALQHAPQT